MNMRKFNVPTESANDQVNTIQAKEKLRIRVKNDVEKFLANGGSIQVIPNGFGRWGLSDLSNRRHAGFKPGQSQQRELQKNQNIIHLFPKIQRRNTLN